MWWLCHLSSQLDGTTFPRFPFPVSFYPGHPWERVLRCAGGWKRRSSLSVPHTHCCHHPAESPHWPEAAAGSANSYLPLGPFLASLTPRSGVSFALWWMAPVSVRRPSHNPGQSQQERTSVSAHSRGVSSHAGGFQPTPDLPFSVCPVSFKFYHQTRTALQTLHTWGCEWILLHSRLLIYSCVYLAPGTSLQFLFLALWSWEWI